MKRSTLYALFITASALASPAFAAGDNCDKNLQVVKDGIATFSAPTESEKNDLLDLQAKAQSAKDAGNEKDCVALTGQAIKILQDNSKSKS